MKTNNAANNHVNFGCPNLCRFSIQLWGIGYAKRWVNSGLIKIMDRSNIRLEIWERGAGYTLASGSSSSAAAAVAFRLGLCDSQVWVHMPGGKLEIHISEDYSISLTGPVIKIAEGTLSPEMFSQVL